MKQQSRVSSTVVHDQKIKVAAADQDKLKHNEIPLSPGKLREKYKVSIAYVSEDGDKRESIIGYYDTEIEAIEAYEQTEQSIRHANHRQVTSDSRSENEMEQETDLEEIFDRIVKSGTHETHTKKEDQGDDNAEEAESKILEQVENKLNF